MNHFPRFRPSWIAAACLFAAGCATTPTTTKLYDGPDRPATELARVMVPYTIGIQDINGSKPNSEMRLQSAKEQQLLLLPGTYVFGVRFSSPYEFGTDHPGLSTLRTDHKANLEAGHTYRFKSRVKGDDASAHVDVWIEDEGTTAQVDDVPTEPAPKPAAAAETPSTPPASPSSSLDDLKRDWKNASPDARAEFLKSIVTP